MRAFVCTLTLLSVAATATPAFAQKGFGPKGDSEAKIKKLEADLKKTQEELQALQQELKKGKGKPAAKELDKKREEMKKFFEDRKADAQKKMEEMKKFADGKKFGRGAMPFGPFGMGKGKFGGRSFGDFKKPDFKRPEAEKKPDLKKPDFKRPDIKKEAAPGRPGFPPAARDADTDQLLRQILDELKQMRKEQQKLKR